MSSTALFARTNPLKLFFLAAIPGAVSMLFSALYQTFDGMFVGQFVGRTAFAAINLAMPFVIINFSLADLIGVGSSVSISIALGRKQREEANNIFTCACLMIVSTGILIGGLLYVLAPTLIALMGAQGQYAVFAAQYIRVYALCSPVTTIIFALDNYLRICGYIRGSMMMNIGMSVLSAGLEWLFLGVFGFHIGAAALATCSGIFVCVCCAMIPFIRGKSTLRFCIPRFHARMIRQIVSCGLPNFLNNIAGRIASILMNIVLVRLGGADAVSIYGVLMYTDGFVQPLLYGTCDSLQPAIGYNWGAQKYSRVRAIERCCYVAAAVISLSALAVIVLCPGFITRLFLPDATSLVANTTAHALHLFSLTYLTRWFSFATQSYMLAIEKYLPASLISISTALLFPALLLVLLWPLKLTGIWLNFALSSLLAAMLSLFVLLRQRRLLSRPDGRDHMEREPVCSGET